MEPEKKKRWYSKAWKWARNTLLVLASIVAILVSLIVVFEEKIKRYAISYLNQYLTTEVRVESIDLDVFSRFPNASLRFTNVVIMDPPHVKKLRDTLLYAKELHLEFGIWDLFGDDISVKNITALKADIRHYTDENGNANHEIWKEPETKSESSGFGFNLELLFLKDSKLRFVHKPGKQDHAFLLDELQLKGKFTEKAFAMKTGFKGTIRHIKNRGITLIKNKSAEVQVGFDMDRNAKIHTISTGELLLGDMRFGIEGTIDDKEATQLDLAINGKDIRIESLLKTFPELLGDDLEAYRSKGKLDFASSVKGPSADPDIAATFTISNAELSEKATGIKLYDLNFKGDFKSKNKNEKERLLIEELSGKFSDGSFSGKLKLSDFERPFLFADLKGNFNLATLHQFFKFKEVQKADGGLQIAARLETRFTHDTETEKWSMDVQKANGSAAVKDMNLKLTDHHVAYKNLNGKFTLSNNNAFVEGLKGHLGKTDIAIDGVLENLVPYLLLRNEKLTILADLRSELADLNDLFAIDNSEELKENNAATSGTDVKFPNNINFNLNATIGRIEYSTFNAGKIKGNLRMIDKVFQGKNLSMVFAKGHCSGELEVDGSNAKELGITGKVDISEMDIRETFTLFRDFGQNVVKQENIKGLLSASVEFGFITDSSLRINEKKIISIAKIQITNGELIALLSLKDVSDYMRKDKKIKMALGKNIDDLEKRLSHIRFSELKNTLQIRNGKVIIPEMEIESSALSIRFWGEHGFDNTIDYHINFRFRELKTKMEETEYGYIEDDGTGFRVYIHMYGDINNPQFENDSKERKQDRKEYNQAEKQNIKAILKQEFGLYKKDSTLKINETPEQKVKFMLEWEQDQPTDQPTDPNKDKTKRDNKDRMDKFKKKLGVQEDTSKTGFRHEQ